MAEKLPTQAGRKALLNIFSGRPTGYGFCYGSNTGTIWSLRRNGLIDHESKLTEAGQKMVERLTVTPEVTNG